MYAFLDTLYLSAIDRTSIIKGTHISQVLEANGGSASGGTLILVSDGKENQEPDINAVTPTLVHKSVTVHTILISEAAEPKLIKLAADTNGNSFFDSGSIDSTDLVSAFRSTVSDEDSGIPGAAAVEVGCNLPTSGATNHFTTTTIYKCG